jgi:hypothetical protein
VSGLLARGRGRADLLAADGGPAGGIAGCLARLGGLPRALVWDRQAGIHGHGGRPSEAFAGFCGQLRVDWRFCEPADPQAKGAVERPQGYAETNFEPGRRFANELDFQDQLDAWFRKVNARTHKTLRARPLDRLVDERQAMAPLPDQMPDTARRWTMRVPSDPHLRLDTNDYSLDPALVGRRVEVRVDQQMLTAVALDTGELACRHARVFARHRTITALEHARALKSGQRDSAATPVEVRPLARYDQLSHDARLLRTGAPVPGAEGAGRRASVTQARRPGPRRGVVL